MQSMGVFRKLPHMYTQVNKEFVSMNDEDDRLHLVSVLTPSTNVCAVDYTYICPYMINNDCSVIICMWYK